MKFVPGMDHKFTGKVLVCGHMYKTERWADIIQTALDNLLHTA